jgi:hypothetical protein
MSLAITAAPIDSDNRIYNNSNNDSVISKKRNAHNKTQKRTNLDEDFDSDKVNSVIQSIHRSSLADSSEGADLGDFKPIAPPTSMGVENTKLRENFAHKNNLSNTPNNNSNNNVNEYNPNDLLDNNTLAENFLNSQQVKDYYNKLLPTYQPTNTNSIEGYKNYISTFNQGPASNTGDANSLLLEKLNYMINLLEEQKDERTNNVTEEVVLYSFLGIFIIFIVDSFARVGKYTR